MNSRILKFAIIVLISNLMLLCSLSSPTTSSYGSLRSPTPVANSAYGINEPAYPNATIALLKEVTICGPVVTVGIIADIQSEDKALVEKLSEIEIERAPVVGYTRVFNVNDVKLRLRQHKIDLSQITFAGNERVAVSQKAIEITSEQLLNFARKYIQENILADKYGRLAEYRSSIELAALPVKLTIPDGEVSFRIPWETAGEVKAERSEHHNVIQLSQYMSIPIQIILNGKTYRTLILSLKIKLFKEVAVAAKAIPKDKILSEGDICLEERDLMPVWGVALVDRSEVYGKRAKVHISQGKIITDELIETPPIIYRGDKVNILVELPNLKVTALGMAKEDGYKGKIIRVENISSKKIINAKVISEKLVRVEL